MQRESKYAIFNFSECDSALIDDLSSYLDANAAAIYDFFGVQPKEKVQIDIIPTKKELDEIRRECMDAADRNLPIPSWLIGFCRNGKITYLSFNDYKSTSHAFDANEYDLRYEYFLKTIVHEFVHRVNQQYEKESGVGFTHKCFSEGIATILSKQKDEKDVKFNFSLDRVLWTDKSKSCYDGWYLVTKYFIENYDHDFVLKMMLNEDAAQKFIADELYAKAKNYYMAQEQVKGQNVDK